MREHPIFTEEGKLFCKCQDDEQGNPVLVGKNGKISVQDLMANVYHLGDTLLFRDKRTSYYK